MILVTGATGPLGGGVVNFLLQKTDASNIAALVRDPAKAADLKSKGVDIRQGDYNDYASLVKAFSGITKIYFVSGSDVINRGAQHINVINAAKEAGVKHVLYTSFQRKDETEDSPIALVAKSHIDTEVALKESGLSYTILKHNLYADVIPMFLGEKVVEMGAVFIPADDGKAAYATRQDLAEAGANILTSEGHENKSYDLSGIESVSYGDVAQILGDISGKEITYVSPPHDVFKAELTKAGVPEMYIDLTANFAEAIKQGQFDFPGGTLESFLGRKPTSIREFLTGIYGGK